MGVPLINAIYEDNPLVGLYTLPLLIWHPMQLVVGSFLAPYLMAFVNAEKERLGISDDDDDNAQAGGSPVKEEATSPTNAAAVTQNDEETGLHAGEPEMSEGASC